MNVNDGLRNSIDFLMICRLKSYLDFLKMSENELRNTLDFLIMRMQLISEILLIS